MIHLAGIDLQTRGDLAQANLEARASKASRLEHFEALLDGSKKPWGVAEVEGEESTDPLAVGDGDTPAGPAWPSSILQLAPALRHGALIALAERLECLAGHDDFDAACGLVNQAANELPEGRRLEVMLPIMHSTALHRTEMTRKQGTPLDQGFLQMKRAEAEMLERMMKPLPEAFQRLV
jgi:hypothetical protein